MLPGAPAFPIRLPWFDFTLHLKLQLFTNTHPGRQKVMVLLLGPYQLQKGAGLILGFLALARPNHDFCRHLGNKSACKICFCLYVCLSNKKMGPALWHSWLSYHLDTVSCFECWLESWIFTFDLALC